MSWTIEENVFDRVPVHLFQTEKKLDCLIRSADLFHPFDLFNSFEESFTDKIVTSNQVTIVIIILVKTSGNDDHLSVTTSIF